MDISERFKYIMKLNQLSASAFAEEIGVQRSSISHVLSGRNKPSLEFIQKVLNRFPKVDANWLINGSTNMQEKEVKGETSADQQDVDREKEPPQKESLNKTGHLDQTVVNSEPVAQYGEKEIERILVFYSDQTFKEFTPS